MHEIEAHFKEFQDELLTEPRKNTIVYAYLRQHTSYLCLVNDYTAVCVAILFTASWQADHIQKFG